MTTKTLLIDNLANRLFEYYENCGQKQWLNAAVYCYIINADYMNLSKLAPFGSLLDQIELALILQKSTNAQFVVNKLSANYAKLLAIDGKLELALKYIDDFDIELKDRIIGNLRPNARRHSIQTNAVAPRIQKPVQPFNRVATSHATAFPYDSMAPVQYTPSMPSYNVVQSETRNRSQSLSQPIVPAVPNVYSLSHQSTPFTPEPYVGQSYDEQHNYSQAVTPGWNDPPVMTSSRLSQPFEPQQPLAPIFNPLPGNTIATPLSPVVEYETIQSNANHSSLSRRQSLPPPSVEVLSPQNQLIYDAFERLLSHLQQNSNSQALNIRRKLEDAKVKLETLKSKLSSNSQLSSNTISGLNDIANAINHNDFNTALQCHTNLVTSTTFGETSAFLPAIKIILQLAQHKIQT